MITRAEQRQAQQRAAELLQKTGLAIRQEELANIEIADFGLGELATTGAAILTLVDTGRLVVKLLTLFPDQTLPEHRHPRLDSYEGKEETIRCEWGELYLYGSGEAPAASIGHPPAHRRRWYTVWHEYRLRPGEQITLPPDTPHWFQGGPTGAVVWSITTRAADLQDVFTDPQVVRQTVIVE
jgi:D-lyxose ketol-isomerase